MPAKLIRYNRGHPRSLLTGPENYDYQEPDYGRGFDPWAYAARTTAAQQALNERLNAMAGPGPYGDAAAQMHELWFYGTPEQQKANAEMQKELAVRDAEAQYRWQQSMWDAYNQQLRDSANDERQEARDYRLGDIESRRAEQQFGYNRTLEGDRFDQQRQMADLAHQNAVEMQAYGHGYSMEQQAAALNEQARRQAEDQAFRRESAETGHGYDLDKMAAQGFIESGLSDQRAGQQSDLQRQGIELNAQRQLELERERQNRYAQIQQDTTDRAERMANLQTERELSRTTLNEMARGYIQDQQNIAKGLTHYTGEDQRKHDRLWSSIGTIQSRPDLSPSAKREAVDGVLQQIYSIRSVPTPESERRVDPTQAFSQQTIHDEFHGTLQRNPKTGAFEGIRNGGPSPHEIYRLDMQDYGAWQERVGRYVTEQTKPEYGKSMSVDQAIENAYKIFGKRTAPVFGGLQKPNRPMSQGFGSPQAGAGPRFTVQQGGPDSPPTIRVDPAAGDDEERAAIELAKKTPGTVVYLRNGKVIGALKQ